MTEENTRTLALAAAISLAQSGEILADKIVQFAKSFQEFLDNVGDPEYRYFRYEDSDIWYRVRAGQEVAERAATGVFSSGWSTQHSHANPRTLEDLQERHGYYEVTEAQVPTRLKEGPK